MLQTFLLILFKRITLNVLLDHHFYCDLFTYIIKLTNIYQFIKNNYGNPVQLKLIGYPEQS